MIKRIAKKSKIRILAGVIILGLITGIAWTLFNPGESDAAWFDDTYSYRTIYSFTHNAALTNRRIDITINTSTLVTAGKMQSDCDDSRFTDITGKKLRYQLVSGCNTSSTSYSVVIPTVISGANTYYFYYGNPLATSLSDSTVASVTSVTPSGGAPSAGSEEQGPRPVLYWKLDEGTGTTVNDSSANNNSGTLAASTATPTWQTEDQCINGKCLKFDGSNDYLSRTYSSDTELAPGTASFTITAWAKHPTTISGTDTIISRSNGAVNGIGYKLYMNSSGFICFGIDDDATSFPEDSACSTTSYADSKWHFIEGVKSTTASITLYIDGIQIAQDASISATGTLSGTTATLFAGIDSDASSNPWDGFIDEIKYYGYAKSASQVKSDFASKGAVADTAVSFGAKDQTANLSQGLIGYWKMDESSWTTDCSTSSVLDSSGNGNNGKSCPSSTGPSGGGTGKFSYGGSFDGSNDYIKLTSSTSLTSVDTSSAWTISTWINPTTLSTNAILFGSDNDNNNQTYGVLLNGNGSATTLFLRTGLCSGTTTSVTLNQGLTTSTWQLLTITRNNSNVYIYKNGVLIGSSNAYVAGCGSGATMVIGGSPTWTFGDSQATTYFSGKLDDFRLYNRDLSSSEVASLNNWGPGPSAYWKLDDHTGTTALDSSTNANSATLTNGPTWKPGKYGSGILFDGSNDYAVITDASSLQIGANESVTLSAWFKTSQTDGTILSKNGTSLSDVYDLKLNFGCLRIDAKDSSFNGANTFGTNRCGLNDNVWHYGAFTYDRLTGVSKLYVDGILDISQTQSPNPTGAIGSTANAYIGSEEGTSNFFTGSLDDIKIYKYARTAKQILQDMNAGAPSIGGPGTPGNAVAYWSMDEGQGTTANDKSGNSKSLTLNTASWTNSGAFGKAWNGLGTNWLSRSDDNDLDFAASDDFSISMWIKSDSASNPGGAEYLLSKLESSAGYRLRFNSSGQIGFAIDDDSAFTPDDEAVTTTDYYDNNWHHIVAIKSGTSKIELFVDGKSAASDTSLAATGSLANSVTMYLGDRNGVDGGDEFNGDIDEVKIYRFALTPDEVKSDYNQGSAQKLGALSTASNGTTVDNSSAREYCIPGDTTSCSSPIGEWKLDERTGSTANDTSGNANSGSWNGTGTHWAVGKIGQAGKFNGTDDYILLNTITPNTFSNITIEGWINPTALPGATDRIINVAASDAYIGLNTSGNIKVNLFDGVTNKSITTSGTNYTNRWTYVVLTANGTTLSLYINGVLYGTTPAGSMNWESSTKFSIGASQDGTLFHTGYVDHVRVFNYARTSSQVAWDYNQGAPLAWYKFDECQGTTANDASGNSNNAAITIGATGTYTSVGTCNSGSSSQAWNVGTSGKYGSSIAYDGTDDYSVITANTALNTLTSAFSTSLWVKPIGAIPLSFKRFISRGSNPSQEWELEFTSVSQGKIFYATGASSSTSTNALSTGVWSHLTMTYDGANTSTKLYINGILDSSFTAPSTVTASSNIGIGADADGTDLFTGQIDEVRIYNYPLTAVQVKNVYNEGSAVRFGQ